MSLSWRIEESLCTLDRVSKTLGVCALALAECPRRTISQFIPKKIISLATLVKINSMCYTNTFPCFVCVIFITQALFQHS